MDEDLLDALMPAVRVLFFDFCLLALLIMYELSRTLRCNAMYRFHTTVSLHTITLACMDTMSMLYCAQHMPVARRPSLLYRVIPFLPTQSR